MKNIKDKIQKLFNIMNGCSPDEYFHSRFHDFCLDLVYEDEDPSLFLEEEDYLQIYEDVKSFFPEGHQEQNESSKYFSFGIFCFKCYLFYCLKVAKTAKRGMVRFCDKVEHSYFSNTKLINDIYEYFMYFKRGENKEIENKQVSYVVERLSMLNSIGKLNMPFEIGDEEAGDIEELGDVIGSRFMSFMDGVMLACSHFVNCTDTMVLMSDV
jgi:hypothetical protein